MPLDVSKYVNIKKNKKPTCIRLLRIFYKTITNFITINIKKYLRFVKRKHDERNAIILAEKEKIKQEQQEQEELDLGESIKDFLGCGFGCIMYIGCLWALIAIVGTIFGIFTGTVHISSTAIIIFLLVLLLFK